MPSEHLNSELLVQSILRLTFVAITFFGRDMHSVVGCCKLDYPPYCVLSVFIKNATHTLRCKFIAFKINILLCTITLKDIKHLT